MSWDMWHQIGIGFDISKADDEKVQDFFIRHLKTLVQEGYNKEFIDFIYDHPLYPISQDDFRDQTDSYSLADPIAFIMAKETDLVFWCPGLTDDGEDCVLYCRSYPWELKEKEKALTRDSLIEIMQSYAEELGLKVEEDIDLVYAG